MFAVPQDLDVKMKAVLLGATFLIVSGKTFAYDLWDNLVFQQLIVLQDMMYFEHQKNNNNQHWLFLTNFFRTVTIS